MDLMLLDYQSVIDVFSIIFSYAAPIGVLFAVISRVLRYLMGIIGGEERVRLWKKWLQYF